MAAVLAPAPIETLLPSNPAELIFSDHAFARLERVADIMASGKATIPAHLRGNSGDCFAILLQSARWGMDPFAVAQKTHLVNGALGYEAQLVIAVLNANAPLQDRLQFAWFGPWDQVANGKTDKSAAGVRVFATLRGAAAPTVLEITLAQAGVRNSPLWADDPRQQLAYLAAKRWARLYCPDVILGVYTPDELIERDMGPAERVPAPSRTAPDAIMASLTPAPRVPDTAAAPGQGRGPGQPEPLHAGRPVPKKTPDPAPTLADITARINAAATLDELTTVAKASKWLPLDDLPEARTLWAMKAELLRRQAAELAPSGVEGVDPETGEVLADG